MGTPFMAEMRIMSFGFPPKGWAQCNGQLLPINQNQALFSLLGTTYGGDGRVNFGLPDYRGRVPIYTGPQFSTLGQKGGQEAHTLILSEMPAHNHFANASQTLGDTNFIQTTFPPPGSQNILAAATGAGIYGGATALTTLNPSSITNFGGSQAHENRQPYLVLNFCIALQGTFPSQN
jgi:microcystin-dependent protein